MIKLKSFHLTLIDHPHFVQKYLLLSIRRIFILYKVIEGLLILWQSPSDGHNYLVTE